METKITAAIVDDEQGNRENLLRMLGTYCPQIKISAICSSVTEARTVLPEAKPDILFLDIRLGDDTGFSLLESLPDIPFEVIFVTAYDSYAIQAIRFSALDYLLKPIDPEELTHAVDKAVQVVLRKQENKRMQNLLQNKRALDKQKKIALSVADKIEFVEIGAIVRCESESNYTTFYLKSGETLPYTNVSFDNQKIGDGKVHITRMSDGIFSGTFEGDRITEGRFDLKYKE